MKYIIHRVVLTVTLDLNYNAKKENVKPNLYEKKYMLNLVKH